MKLGRSLIVGAFLGPDDAAKPPKVKEICNTLNNYFSSVGLQLANALHPLGPEEVNDADYAV